MKKKSLESATHGYLEPASRRALMRTWRDETTVLLLSKAQWNGLQQDKKFVYNDQTLTGETR